MRSLAIVASLTTLSMGSLLAAEKAQERLQDSAAVLREVMSTPDKGIPHDLFANAKCVVILPGLKKAAFIVGGEFGKGFAVCRSAGGVGWGAPAAVRMEGGSVGFQIGGESTDLIMLVNNQRGMDRLLSDKFTLGADASVAAGPVGRTTAAETDAEMHAEILAWSRSRGAFAGISLNGATLRNDLDDNEELYGRKMTNKEVILGHVAPPPSARGLISALDDYSAVKEGSSDRVRH